MNGKNVLDAVMKKDSAIADVLKTKGNDLLLS
jgi:hypothetical protein